MTALLLVGLLGCSENELINKPATSELPASIPPSEPPPTEVSPNIVVDPVHVDFGVVPTGQDLTDFFTVSNDGDGVLSVSNISLSGDANFALSGATTFTLAPGETSQVDVTYLSSGGQAVATATVLSDDADEPAVEVLLTGAAAFPDLEVTALVDFGTVDASCVDVLPFTLSNVGADVLTVTSLDFVENTGAMTLEAPPSVPFVLDPGQSQLVLARYAPSEAGVATALLTVSSNDPDGDETGQAVGVAEVDVSVDSLITPPDPPLDVVFAVDQSCSMDSHAQNMSSAITDFISGLGGVTNDWRVGVVTLDEGCFNTWFDATTPDFEDLFEDAVRLGGDNDPDTQDTERLFAVSGRALLQTLPGACNDGFRRPDGFLHLIMVSDEEEQSHDPEGPLAPYDTVPGAIGLYESFVSSPGMLQASVVANLQNTCQNQNDALAQGAARYIEMADATGGLALDICDSQWGARMADLGSQLPAEFTVSLASIPDPSTIAVSVNGGVLIGGFTYDPTTNSVVVTAPLPAGSSIEVSYALPAVCN